MLDKDEISTIVTREIESSIGFHSDQFEEERLQATDYYFGRAIGDEREGFSQVVSTDVADSVEFMMPSIMRVFMETENYVEFKPRNEEDVQPAKQATDYCNWVMESNGAFTLLHHFFKDALLYKTGVIKVHVEEESTVNERQYEGVGYDDIHQSFMSDDMEIVGQDMRPDGLFDLSVKQTDTTKRIALENVPPEEFLISSRAKSVADARFVGHRRGMSISDLVEMGYDEDEVEEYGGQGEAYYDNETQHRHQDIDGGHDESSDDSQREVEVVEGFIRIDADEDGIAELRRVVCIGPGRHILTNEPADCKPFVMVSPIMVPHRAIGRSISELLFSVQVIKSQLMRQMLDNMYRMNNARLAYVDGQVNTDDILRNVPGSPIRMRAPGMVQEIKPQGLVNDALSAINYIDHVKEERTGVSKAAMGLDADALQSTSAVGINATVSAAQGKLEMIARVFAETGLKELFRLILKRSLEFDVAPQIVRLRNDFITLDPSTWKTAYDMTVNVGLGSGQRDDKLSLLSAIAAKQEQILLQAGMDNPLVTPDQYAASLSKMVELAGFKDTQSYVNKPEMVLQKVEQQKAQAAQQQPQPTPEMIKAQQDGQLAQMKAQADAQLDQAKAQAKISLEREVAMARLEIEKFKAGMQAEIKQQELEVEATLEGIRTANGLAGGNADLNLND